MARAADPLLDDDPTLDPWSDLVSRAASEELDLGPRHPFLSVDQLLADTGEGVQWMVDGLLAAGMVTLLVGPPKIGKSTLLFYLLAAQEAGTRFLGLVTSQCSAVVLSEEPPAALQQKARAFGIRQAIFLPRQEAYNAGLSDLLERAVAEAARCNASVLVIDTLAYWAGLGPEAENDAGAIQRAMAPILRAADRGLAILMIHHARKAGGTGVAASRGSTALPGAVDVHVTLVKPKDCHPGERRLYAVGRIAGTPDCLRYVYEDGVIRGEAQSHEKEDALGHGGGGPPAGENRIEDQIVGLLRSRHPEALSSKTIQEKLGRQRQRVLLAIRHLLDEERLVGTTANGRRGPYELVPGSLPVGGEPGTASDRDDPSRPDGQEGER